MNGTSRCAKLQFLKNEITTEDGICYRDLWKAGIDFEELVEAKDEREYPYLYYYDDFDGDGKTELAINQGCMYLLKYIPEDNTFKILYTAETRYFKKFIDTGMAWEHDGQHADMLRDRIVVMNDGIWNVLMELEQGIGMQYRYFEETGLLQYTLEEIFGEVL